LLLRPIFYICEMHDWIGVCSTLRAYLHHLISQSRILRAINPTPNQQALLWLCEIYLLLMSLFSLSLVRMLHHPCYYDASFSSLKSSPLRSSLPPVTTCSSYAIFAPFVIPVFHALFVHTQRRLPNQQRLQSKSRTGFIEPDKCHNMPMAP